MNASTKETELSRVACLLDELDGQKWEPAHWRGYHPAVYNQHVDADALVAQLCSRLQEVDVTQYSLEMQMWWRDHQEADRTRLKREAARHREAADRDAALAKLTTYERGLLGLS